MAATVLPLFSLTPVAARPTAGPLTAWRLSSVLGGPPHTAAEAAVAVDPHDPQRIAVAADPYRPEARISVVVSQDGGATWQAPIDILPPGYAKSYDPTVLFGRDGRLTVVGGASQLGPRHCQPGSSVFAASVNADRSVAFRMVGDQHPADTYVDRPTAAIDPRNDDVYVSWTQSSGPGAECRGTPSSSYLLLAKGSGSDPFAVLPGIPASGLPAPFGAAIGIDAAGVVWAAVGEHVPGHQTRLSATSSSDGGKSFAAPSVLEDGPARPATLPGLGGLDAPIPSLSAGAAGQVIVTWALPGADGGRVAVYQHGPTGWANRDVPATAGTTPLLSGAVMESGGAVLVTASVVNATLVFEARGGTGAWSPPETLTSAPAGGYQEVGEGLGLATASGVTAWAVPVDAAASSSIVVGTRGSAPPVGGSTGATRAAKGAARSASWTDLLIVVAVIGGLTVAGLRLTRTARGYGGGRRRW